jgi:hypothetical protein
MPFVTCRRTGRNTIVRRELAFLRACVSLAHCVVDGISLAKLDWAWEVTTRLADVIIDDMIEDLFGSAGFVIFVPFSASTVPAPCLFSFVVASRFSLLLLLSSAFGRSSRHSASWNR